jgi:hypothetical protein
MTEDHDNADDAHAPHRHMIRTPLDKRQKQSHDCRAIGDEAVVHMILDFMRTLDATT